MSCSGGCDAFFTAAEPGLWGVRGTSSVDRDIARAGVAVGADGIFIETHPDPRNAKSDGANMLQLDLLEGLLERLVRIRKAIL